MAFVPDAPAKLRFVPDQSDGMVASPSGPTFEEKYTQDAQSSLGDKIGKVVQAPISILGGLLDLGKKGLQGLGQEAGKTVGDIENAPDLSSKIKSYIQANLRGAQTVAEGGARAGVDLADQVRQAGMYAGSKMIENPIETAAGPGALISKLIRQGLSSRTPSALEVALAKGRDNQNQTVSKLKQDSILPEVTGEKPNLDVSNLISILAQGALPVPKALGASRIPPVIGEASTIPLAEAAVNAAKAVPGEVSSAVKSLPTIQRRSINAAQKAAGEAQVNALPEVARNAAKNGVPIRDVNLIQGLSEGEKPLAKRMVAEAEDFANNRTAKSPALTVGEEAYKRVSEAKKLLNKQGQELGNYVKGFTKETVTGAEDAVLGRLEQNPAFSGVKLDADGLLDFSDTALASSLSKGDREIIQKAFGDIRGKSPLQIHKLRQGLFDVIGGEVTGKVDSGLASIRDGLADTLESLSPEYKKLNKAYARTREPLDDLRRHFRNVEGSSADILNEKASLLARRLTSNAASAPDLRAAFGDLEGILGENGVKFDTNLNTVQELYNTLNRHFPIEKDTSLGGIVKSSTGAEVPTSLNQLIGTALSKTKKAIVGNTEITPAVRQKYLKDLINGLERKTSLNP